VDELITQSSHRFNHVENLTLSGLTLPSMGMLMSILDLSYIRELNILQIENISIDAIHLLIKHTSHLNHLMLPKFIPLFIPPLHIHELTIYTWNNGNDAIERFCSIFSHIRCLTISFMSIEMMAKLLNRLKYLECVFFRHEYKKYPPYFSQISLEQNFDRLRRDKFTYKEGEWYFRLSIGEKQ
jgi:hypothetical protein